jgi:hypothetical protein
MHVRPPAPGIGGPGNRPCSMYSIIRRPAQHRLPRLALFCPRRSTTTRNPSARAAATSIGSPTACRPLNHPLTVDSPTPSAAASSRWPPPPPGLPVQPVKNRVNLVVHTPTPAPLFTARPVPKRNSSPQEEVPLVSARSQTCEALEHAPAAKGAAKWPTSKTNPNTTTAKTHPKPTRRAFPRTVAVKSGFCRKSDWAWIGPQTAILS